MTLKNRANNYSIKILVCDSETEEELFAIKSGKSKLSSQCLNDIVLILSSFVDKLEWVINDAISKSKKLK